MELKLRNIITSLSGVSQFTLDTELEELGIDSLMTMELLISIEASFHVEIDESHLGPENFKTPRTLLNLIERVSK